MLRHNTNSFLTAFMDNAMPSDLKYAALYTVLPVLLAGCFHQASHPREDANYVSIEPQHVFAHIGDGGGVTRVVPVTIKNNSNHVIQIETIETSCGCTVVENWPKGPISPLAESKFDVSVSLPDFGRKSSQLKITFVEDSAPHTIVFDLHGKSPEVPRLKAPLQRVSLKWTSISEDIDRRFAFQTLEKKSSVPWLCGVWTDVEWMNAELTLSSERESKYDGLVERAYMLNVKCRWPLSLPGTSGISKIFFEVSHAEPAVDPWVMDAVLVPRVRSIPSRLVYSPSSIPCEFRVLLISEPPLVVENVRFAERTGMTVEAISTSATLHDDRKVFKLNIDPSQFICTSPVDQILLESSESGERLGHISVEYLKPVWIEDLK